jgi:hypothetical protein
MGLAKGNPSAVSKKNKGVLAMSKEQLSDFAATPEAGLPLVATAKPPAPIPKKRTKPTVKGQQGQIDKMLKGAKKNG